MRQLVISLIMLVCASSIAETQPTVDFEAILADLAKPIPEDVLFYRWQSTVSGENLHKAGKMTEKLDKYFMAIDSHAIAGPGIYLAGSPESSSSYLPKEGGNLLEVTIKKGTPFLDLQDAEVIELLKARGVTTGKLMAHKIKSPVVLMYARDWYVGKNLQDKAGFELFPGPSHDTASLRRVHTDLQFDSRASDQAFAQMQGRRPELLKEIGENPKMGDFLAARLATPEKMLALIRQTAESRWFNDNEMIRTFLYMPDKGKVIFSDPALAKKIKEKLVSSASDYDFAQIVRFYPDDWAADYLVNSSDQARFIEFYLEKIKDVPNEEFVKRLSEVERQFKAQTQSGFSEAMKMKIGGSLSERISLARQKHLSAAALTKIANLDFVSEKVLGRIKTRLGETEAYRLSFDQALKNPNRTSYEQLLNRTDGIGDFQRVLAETPSENSGLFEEIINEKPSLYWRQVRQQDDVTKVMEVSDKLKKMGVNVSANNVGVYLKIGGDSKKQFIVKCLESDSCRPHLSGKWNQLLEGIEDLEDLGTAVRKISDRRVSEKFEKDIFSAVKSAKQMTSFSRWLIVKTRRDVLLAKIKEIGLGNFRPKDIDRIIPLASLASGEKKAALNLAIQGVVNAEDAIFLKKILVENGLHKTELIRVLARKMEQTNPTAQEVEKFESLGKVMGVQVKPSQKFDCLSAWARALRG